MLLRQSIKRAASIHIQYNTIAKEIKFFPLKHIIFVSVFMLNHGYWSIQDEYY